jgi:hypothetical protein
VPKASFKSFINASSISSEVQRVRRR